MPKPIYNIDLYKLERWWIPIPLRKSKTMAFARAIISGLLRLVSDFNLFLEYTSFIIHTTGQVSRLRGALNDKFDPVFRRIYITDGVRGTPFFVYTEAENKPQYLPRYLHSVRGYDFIIWLPDTRGMHRIVAELILIVDRFKLPTKTYLIKYF